MTVTSLPSANLLSSMAFELAGLVADGEDLFAGEAEGFDVLAGQELQRQDAHADEVGAVDALVALGDDEADAEQARAFGGPVARGAGAVLLAGEDRERGAALGVGDGGVVDRHAGVVGEQAGDAALGAGGELVAQADVGEGAAHHDFVVAAAGAVAVEVGGLDAVVGEVLAGRAVELDGAGGRDVVGGDGVAEDGEDAGAVDVFDGRGCGGHAVEVGGFADVGGVRLPAVGVAGGELEVLPVLVAVG